MRNICLPHPLIIHLMRSKKEVIDLSSSTNIQSYNDDAIKKLCDIVVNTKFTMLAVSD